MKTKNKDWVEKGVNMKLKKPMTETTVVELIYLISGLHTHYEGAINSGVLDEYYRGSFVTHLKGQLARFLEGGVEFKAMTKVFCTIHFMCDEVLKRGVHIGTEEVFRGGLAEASFCNDIMEVLNRHYKIKYSSIKK